MIEYLYDSCTGRIDNYPHKVQGNITVHIPGVSQPLTGCPYGCEILKCDNQYIYIRDSFDSNRAIVVDENSREVEKVPVSNLGL